MLRCCPQGQAGTPSAAACGRHAPTGTGLETDAKLIVLHAAEAMFSLLRSLLPLQAHERAGRHAAAGVPVPWPGERCASGATASPTAVMATLPEPTGGGQNKEQGGRRQPTHEAAAWAARLQAIYHRGASCGLQADDLVALLTFVQKPCVQPWCELFCFASLPHHRHCSAPTAQFILRAFFHSDVCSNFE